MRFTSAPKCDSNEETAHVSPQNLQAEMRNYIWSKSFRTIWIVAFLLLLSTISN